MPKWADIKAGEAVTLKGERYEVTKHKLNKKGTKATVVLEGRRGRFEREVDAKLKVERAPATVAASGRRSTTPAKVKGDPLHDENGTQRRWAKQGELDAVLPPEPAEGGDWAKPKGKAEKALGKVLGAVLVGEATDPDVGWYVPPLDPSTMHAHLLMFHDIEPEARDYAELVKLHDRLHADAVKGPFAPLHVNHWHTKERPSS
jgi:hypothetical protein